MDKASQENYLPVKFHDNFFVLKNTLRVNDFCLNDIFASGSVYVYI